MCCNTNIVLQAGRLVGLEANCIAIQFTVLREKGGLKGLFLYCNTLLCIAIGSVGWALSARGAGGRAREAAGRAGVQARGALARKARACERSRCGR